MQKRGWWKIDQANDRQTEKKGLAELLGRCLAARRPASAAELNTLMLIVFAYLSFCFCVFQAELFRCPPPSQRAAELNTSLLMLIVFAYLSFSTCVFEALFW